MSRLRTDLPADALQKARALRGQQTDAEKRLWSRLRRKQVAGARFRRQMPVGPYIADFACPSAQLIIEVDGGQHGSDSKPDTRRDAWFHARGWRVLRFWNNQVLAETDSVVDEIYRAVRGSNPDHDSD